jgi:chorismate mutase / prephenate dehydratase
MTDTVVAEAREAIDAGDRELLAIVNRRITLVQALHEHKVRTGVPLRDAGREEAMVASLRAVNAGPLSTDGVAELVRFLLDLTRREIHGA